MTPTVVDDPPICSDLGLEEAVRIPGPAGPLRTGVVEFEVDGEPHRVRLVVARDGGPVAFNWSSDLGMAAVVVRGGDDARVYDYRDALATTTVEAVYAADGLAAPFNRPAGRFHTITSVAFCYDDGGRNGAVGDVASGDDSRGDLPDAGGPVLVAGLAAATAVAVRRRS